MPRFGDKSKRPVRSGMFLKNFKDPQTRIAILEDKPEDWFDFKEHYDKNAGKNGIFFPCAKYEGEEECLGCDFPVEHPEYSDLEAAFPGKSKSEARQLRKKEDPGWGVRDVSSKWVFPAISPDNYVNLYKIGFNLWEHFKNQFSVLGTLTGTEFIVSRSGTNFNDTNYTPTAIPGEVRKPKSGVPIPDHKAISEVLGADYDKAMKIYGHEPDEGDVAQPDPAPVPDADEAQANPPSTGDLAADTLAAARANAPATGAATEPITEPGVSPAHGFIPREASTGEIKDWLAALDPPVEFAPRAARPVLVALAEKTMTERSIASF
jgi:hypothetical protein